MNKAKAPRILYVEDIEELAVEVSKFLQAAGYRVTHISNSDDFMALFPSIDDIRVENPELIRSWDESSPERILSDVAGIDIDLILLDHELGASRMKGTELVQWMKRERPYYPIPSILYSTHAKLSDATVAMKYGVVACVERGNQQQLLATISGVLEGRHRRSKAGIVWDALKNDSKLMRFVGAKVQETSKDALPVYLWGPKGTNFLAWTDWISSKTYNGESPDEFVFTQDAHRHELEASNQETERFRDYVNTLASGDVLLVSKFHFASTADQASLLHLIEKCTNIRVICTGERNPQSSPAEGGLIPDLQDYFSRHTIEIPSLKERISNSRKDFRNLTERLMREFHEVNGGVEIELEPDAWECLYAHTWPRNEIELNWVIECMYHAFRGSKSSRRVVPVSAVLDCISRVSRSSPAD